MNLDNLYLNRFRINLKAIDDIFLPPYKGFALRGVFGTVLRELACAVASADCASCGRRDGCGYINCGGPSPVATEMTQSAEEIRVTSAALTWLELDRYSTRQRMRLGQGGLMGTITFKGDSVGTFVPLLRLGEYLHLGKSTTFGLGAYRLAVA